MRRVGEANCAHDAGQGEGEFAQVRQRWAVDAPQRQTGCGHEHGSGTEGQPGHPHWTHSVAPTPNTTVFISTGSGPADPSNSPRL